MSQSSDPDSFLSPRTFTTFKRVRERGSAPPPVMATFFGTTSDTGHLTVGVSLRQIAGDMTQFSRIYNTVIVASNQGSRSVPEAEGGFEGEDANSIVAKTQFSALSSELG